MADYPLIQGQTAGSWNEVYIAYALDKLRIPYIYQYAMGFRGVRGDYRIDFVVSNPFQVPVEVFGEYWHTGQLGSDDKLRLAIIENKFRRETIIIWGNECDTQEKADAVVKQRLA